MDMTNSPSGLHATLAAGRVRVVPRMSGESLRRMGAKSDGLVDMTLAEVDGPWGALRMSMDGYPLSVRAQVDGQIVATFTAVSETVNEEGPVPTFTGRDVPVVLGAMTAGVRFVAEGSRLRPAGRRRFLRVTAPDRAWTYGSTQTQTGSANPVGKVLGVVGAPTELRRGPDPATGPLAVSWEHQGARDEKDPSGRLYVTLSWADGATVEEVVLTMLLFLGTNETKLTPLWWRVVDAGGAS
ncbi:hypothetical protein J1G42_02875 [Cellulomonas sp. zg-ZUI222]|uniref:hypothetical protein n=1 Tax=Cellulomonas wangleii TaxID=2816956 RepID=UPI001A942CCA|nr:hypothetical protein [Cellulomonas wangleii]MBO0919768.1 hypothetical protein [Cellulomonas wangleii]